MRCRGADSRARRCTCSPYRPPLKRYAPIASVAAFPERHAGWQSLRHTFCGVKFSSLSLRGGRRPTWRPEREARGSALGVQSRGGSCDFAGAFLCDPTGDCEITRPLWGRAMTNLGTLHGRRYFPDNCNCHRRSGNAATDAIGWYVFIGSRCKS